MVLLQRRELAESAFQQLVSKAVQLQVRQDLLRPTEASQTHTGDATWQIPRTDQSRTDLHIGYMACCSCNER
jgi:hypothetical protein